MPGLWFESHVDLRDHPKTDLLMELLCVTRRDAVGLLHFVWGRAMTYAPSGDLAGVTDAQIARWADWDGAPSALVGALMTAGFLDSSRVLHDWEEYAGRWIERREANAERQREFRARRKAEQPVTVTSGSRNGHVGGLPDLTGPNLNQTGQNPTPQTPLRTAEGGRAAAAAGGKRRSTKQEPDYAGGLCPAGCGTTHGGPKAAQELYELGLMLAPAGRALAWSDWVTQHGRKDLAETEVPRTEG